MSTKLTPKSKPATIRREWVKALRSGKYKQGKEQLHTPIDRYNPEEKHCCLGVLELLAVKAGVPDAQNLKENSYPTKTVVKWAKLNSRTGCTSAQASILYKSLSFINDKKGDTWPEICELLETKPEIYFKEL
jgi:hypothetical protein